MSIKNLVNFFQKNLILLLILIMGLVPLLWFRDGLLITGGDFPIPLDPTGNFIKSFFYTWYPYLYGGQPSPHLFAILPWFGFWAFLKAIGFSLLTINKLWFIFVFMLSGLSMYYLITVLFQKKADPILRFIAPLFYMFNVYVMVVAPVMATPLLHGVLPLILGFYIKGLNEKRLSLKYAALVALSSLLVSSAIGNPPIYAILGIMIFSYLIYHLIFEGRRVLLFSLNFTLMTALLYLLVNLWWLYPFVTNVLMQQSSAKETIQPSPGGSPLYETIRLFGSWAFYAGSGGAAYFPFAYHYKTVFFILLTFAIPFLAFLAAFFKRRRKQIIYFLFMALFGISLAHGGVLYNFLYSHIPGFWIFREPFAKFTVLTAISFAILIGFSTSNIYKMLNLRLKNRNHLAKFYLTFVVLVILLTAWPILTGNAIFSQRGSMKSHHVEIPDYWFQAGEWFNNKKGNFRVLVLPENPEGYYCGLPYQWGYGTADLTPYLIHQPLIEERAGLGTSVGHKLSQDLAQSLYDKIRNFDGHNLNVEALGQILNIKYILQRNDVDWELILSENSLPFSPGHLRRALSSEKCLSLEKSLGDLDFYKISDKSFLPHFYVPQNIIYLNGDIRGLVDVVSFKDWAGRSSIYLANKTNKEVEVRLDGANSIFVKADLKNPIGEEELGRMFQKTLLELKTVFFPYARWHPRSFVYPLVLEKEEFNEWRKRNNLEQLFEQKLFYSTKRIVEIEKFSDDASEELIAQMLGRYQNKVEETISILEKIEQEQEKEKFFLLLAKLEISLRAHQERLENLKVSMERKTQFKDVFGYLKRRVDEIKSRHDFSRLVYKLDIPSKGEYEIGIKKDSIGELNSMRAELGGKKIKTVEMGLGCNNWISLGKKKLTPGEHQLVLYPSESENLIDKKNWYLSENLWFQNKKNNFVLSQEIRGYTPDTIFRISFDYKARNGGAGFSIIQNTDKNEGSGEINPLITRTLSGTRSEEFEYAKILIKSGPQASLARFYLFSQLSECKVDDVKFKNVKVERVLEPTIMLWAKTDSIEERQETPRIAFTMVNPTKYRVKIEGAKKPYTLVFSESFHEEWKAYISQSSKLKAQNSNSNIIASYFDGEIKEGEHRNTFLEKATFETWGKKPIAEGRHYLVNGYANSWYITPEDADGRENYEVIIEFWPQRLFYIGLVISGLSLVGCLGYLGFSFTKRKRVVKNES